jgi:hypothetical protein
LSLHNNGKDYSYVDVLDALSLRILIIEQAQKKAENEKAA